MKSSNTSNEKIEDRNGKILKFTGKPGDNWPRILEDFQSAMVRRGFGRYLRVDEDEPVPIVRNAFNSADYNNNNREVHKWEDHCSQVIEHFKSILTREMVDFIGRNFQPDRTNRASIQHVFKMIGESFNTSNQSRIDFVQGKIKKLEKAYDIEVLNKNLEEIKSIQQELGGWSKLTPEPGETLVDNRLADGTLKSFLLQSVEQWTEMKHTVENLKDR
jgi:hypothetical protein